jgi:hypothetical protein
MTAKRPTVDLAAFTASLSPSDQLKAEVPPPITRRADDLYALLLTRTKSASRGDLIAALVQAAPDDPSKLRDLVVAYEDAQVWQTLRHKRTVGKIKLKPRRTGRPKLSD